MKISIDFYTYILSYKRKHRHRSRYFWLCKPEEKIIINNLIILKYLNEI
jgi:hypothetical protein